MRAQDWQIVLTFVALAATSSNAQVVAASPSLKRTVPQAGMQIVAEDGRRLPVALSKPLKLDFEAAKPGESLLDVARRKGYATDAATVGALQRWNPKLASPDEPLPAGQWLNFVRPDVSVSSGSKLAVAEEFAVLTPLVFKSNKVEIDSARSQLLRLKGASQLSAKNYEQLQSTTQQLQHANQRFEVASTTMSSRQRALAAIQIDAATAQITYAAVQSSKPTQNGPLAIQGGVSLTADAESFSLQLSEQPRKLRVVVRPTSAGQASEEFGVYVLPLALVTYGAAVDVSKLKNLLGALAFAKPTSPSVGDVEPGVKYAVWLGPRYAFELMANLVKAGQVKTFIPVDARAATLDDVSFDEADQTKGP